MNTSLNDTISRWHRCVNLWPTSMKREPFVPRMSWGIMKVSACLVINNGVRQANFMCLLRNTIMVASCDVKSHFKRETGMNHTRRPVARADAGGSNRVQKQGFYFYFFHVRLRLRACSLPANTKSNVLLHYGKLTWRAVCSVRQTHWVQTK